MMNTQNTLTLLRAVITAGLRPMDQDDHMAFAGADADAQIGSLADCGTEALLSTGHSVTTKERCEPLVVASGGIVEVHWITAEGEQRIIGIRLEDLS